MKQFHFTNEHLKDYYENRFNEDLKRFFEIEKDNYDVEVVTEIHSHQLHNISSALALSFFFPTITNSDSTVAKNAVSHRIKNNEEEVLFFALISFMFATEQTVYVKSTDKNHKELASCMNACGFPWINAVERMNLYNFLSLFIKEEIYFKEEAEAIRDAMLLVEPFMLDKVIPVIKKWNCGVLNNKSNYDESIDTIISKRIRVGLLHLIRDYFEYHGLTGVEVSGKIISKYYSEHFFDQLKKYFSGAKEKDNYLEILSVDWDNNHRETDGNPGRNVTENLMFASMVLYMVMAEQSILENAPNVIKDYHKCSGWPMIYSGPGSGPYLHPLMMLYYAGLSPMKYETQLLLEVLNKTFPFLRQEMHALLNGKQIKDEESGQRFLDSIRQGRTKPQIKKYLEEEEKSIKHLLNKWITSSSQSWSQILEEGVRIQKEIKRSKQ